jgi:hypothetical protein
MSLEILSRQDLNEFKIDLIQEIKTLLLQTPTGNKEVLKSTDVRKMLGISHGTLQTLRINRTLPYSKVGGTIYYQHADVLRVLQQNKKGD